MVYEVLIGLVAVIAGAIASVAGFGIGSLLTPAVGIRYGIKLAVAVVSLPHFLATALRFAIIRRHLDRRVFWSFGLMSALGGLSGALLHSVLTSPVLGTVLGALLVFAGLMGLTGLSQRMRFGGWVAWIAGALSGLLGGLVGNQGGIRSAALLGFNLQKEAFVATATAVALMVDLARMPVYIATQYRQMERAWPVILIMIAGTVIGTLAGRRVLEKIPDPIFRRIVGGIILALGIALLAGAGR